MLREGKFVTDGGIGRKAKSERKNIIGKNFSLKEKIEKNRREVKESKKKVNDYSKRIKEENAKKIQITKISTLTQNTNTTMRKITTNSNNSNSLLKRMNYQVPQPIRKAKTEEIKDETIDMNNQTEKTKEECVTQLLNNAQKQCIEEAKNSIENEHKRKEYITLEKKMKTLEIHGEKIEHDDEEEEERVSKIKSHDVKAKKQYRLIIKE